MKIRVKKILVASLVAVMLVPAIAQTAFAAGEITPISDSQRYARSELSKMNGSKRLLKAYNIVRKGLKNSKASIDLSECKLSAKEFQKVYYAVTEDNPEIFWIGNYISWMTNGKYVKTCKPEYTMKGNKLKNAKQKYRAKVKSLVSMVDPDMTAYEKEIFIHDMLASSIVYDASSANAHDAYGAIVEGKAVCEGYARAFQHILNECGVQAFGVIGLSNSPGSTTRQSHMWNIVKLGKSWYHVDLTWNDQPSQTYHTYFNLTTEEIKEDHIIKGNKFKIPAANGSVYGRQRYFEERAAYVTEYDRNTVAQALINGGRKATFLVGGELTAETFINTFYSDLSYFMDMLGMYGGISANSSYNGREVVLSVQ